MRSELNGSSARRGARRRLLLVAQPALLGEHDQRRPRSGRRRPTSRSWPWMSRASLQSRPARSSSDERRGVDRPSPRRGSVRRARTRRPRPSARWPASRRAARSSGSRSAFRSCRCRSPSSRRASRPTTGAARARCACAIRCVASASDSVTVGSRPSGTSATITPIAKTKRSVRPMPGERRDDEEQPADRDREQRHDPRHAVELALERAALAPRLLGELGDPAEPGRHPGRRDERLRRARPSTYVPAKTCCSGATRADSPVSVDSSTRRSLGDEQVGVRGDAVARREQQHVARNDLLAGDLDRHRRRAARGRAAAASGAAPRPPARRGTPGRTRRPR